MVERSDHPQILGSKGNDPVRGQGSRSGGSGVTGDAAKQAQPDTGRERSGTGEAAGEGDGV